MVIIYGSSRGIPSDDNNSARYRLPLESGSPTSGRQIVLPEYPCCFLYYDQISINEKRCMPIHQKKKWFMK